MALWNIDLTTEDGALGAAQLGGSACFVAAVLTAWSTAMTGLYLASQGQGAAAFYPIAFSAMVALFFGIIGFRLRSGKGAVWGGVAAAFVALDLLSRLLIGAFSVWMILSVILIIVIINGIRGARALHAGKFDAEEVAEIFG